MFTFNDIKLYLNSATSIYFEENPNDYIKIQNTVSSFILRKFNIDVTETETLAYEMSYYYAIFVMYFIRHFIDSYSNEFLNSIKEDYENACLELNRLNNPRIDYKLTNRE